MEGSMTRRCNQLQTQRERRRVEQSEAIRRSETIAVPHEASQPRRVGDRAGLQRMRLELGIELGHDVLRRARSEERAVERIGPPPFLLREKNEGAGEDDVVAA